MEVLARPRYDADVAWKVGRILMKYRPIAPKPTSCSSSPSGLLEASRRGKRTRGSTKRGRKREISVVTLPLMPETPERKEEPASACHAPITCRQSAARREEDSVATVEEVTDTWRSGTPALSGDEAAVRMALERDACPGFVTDEHEKVTWTNSAYRKMVGTTEGVGLVTRGLVPEGVTCFTCRVRLRYACGRRGRVSMAAPCDVWRLADGKLVWRLDVKAALSLGLSG